MVEEPANRNWNFSEPCAVTETCAYPGSYLIPTYTSSIHVFFLMFLSDLVLIQLNHHLGCFIILVCITYKKKIILVCIDIIVIMIVFSFYGVFLSVTGSRYVWRARWFSQIQS